MSKEEIIYMLQARGQEQEQLFEKARKIRQKEFGDLAYIRAIIEPSNLCRVNCYYCAMRRGSKLINRYRINTDEILRIAEQMIEKGIKVFSLETGEDSGSINTILKSTSLMKQKGCWILGALGDLKRDDYKKLRDAGMDAYLLKFETSDSELFSKLRPGTTLQKRLENLGYLKELGFAISTGNIIGLPGQTLESIVDDILLVKSFEPAMATVAPLIPSPGTPIENQKYGDTNLTLNTISIYRILLPKSHIPALCAWNFYSGLGQVKAFEVGANEVLINTTNLNKLVYNFAIYSKNKKSVSLEEGIEVIKKANLKFDPLKNLPMI